MGGEHAGVGDLVAAAGLQLRPPAGDPLRAARVRRPARPGRGPRRRGDGMTADATAIPVPAEHAAAEVHAQAGLGNPVLGMLLFITSEVMFFAGLFAAYFSIRANAPVWPPLEFHEKLHIFPFVGPAT